MCTNLAMAAMVGGAHLANAAGEPPPMVLSRNISGRPGVKCGSLELASSVRAFFGGLQCVYIYIYYIMTTRNKWL